MSKCSASVVPETIQIANDTIHALEDSVHDLLRSGSDSEQQSFIMEQTAMGIDCEIVVVEDNLSM